MNANRMIVGALVLELASLPLAAQGPMKSMGQPPQFEPYGVVNSTLSNQLYGDMLVSLGFGVHKPITNPVTGLFGVAAEAYHPLPSRFELDGVLPEMFGLKPGVRALATTRALGLAAGLEYDWNQRRRLSGIVSFQTALRRGGILGKGTMVRLDWFPWRDHALTAGVHIPVGQEWAGRTRPRDTDVDEPVSIRRVPDARVALPAEAETAMRRVASAATMILAYTNLFAEDTARVRYGQSFGMAMSTYDAALAAAFSVAARDSALGRSVTLRARAGLLDAVLLPYDSLFGQVKEHATSIRPLTSTAHTGFVQWLRDSSGVAAERLPAITTVHARWMDVVAAIHGQLLAQWRDSRLVWLPLQLALTADQYDEQTEVDALIERAIGRPFTDRNALTYLRTDELPLEIARSIFAARDYHVLWTHDIAGRRDDTKTLDEVSFALVADAYLPALTRAVQRYDSVGGLTQYMILLDQFYYASRNGRMWMDILEDPLNARMKLSANGDQSAREAHLRKRQEELRAAVRQSFRLNQDANANGGDRWLRRMVRVHVNILHPSDFSYRSHRIVPPWPFVPDNITRDHRKLVFYDVTESHPYRGAFMLMGVGIGEHYASTTWEDRGYRVRGPAALEARDAARRALLSNGFRPEDLPLPLRATRPAEEVERQSNGHDYVGRALQLHNETGFGAKEASVARAMLYNLAPTGSLIIVPDPIWVSETWAAMLAGAAARGCKVYVIAPSHENNPNPHAPIEAMEHAVMARLLDISHRLGDEIRRTGGELRVGLYTARAPITDVSGRTAEVKDGLRKYPWIRTAIPFSDATLAVLDRAVERAAADANGSPTLAEDETPRAPQLHQKTQFIARPGAIEALVRQPGWDDVLARSIVSQSRETAEFAEQFAYTTPAVDSAALRGADRMLEGFEQALSEDERKSVSFYFTTGTQNQDPRGIMLDGEATLVVSGVQASVGLVDLYYQMARSTWIERQEELDRLLPPPGGFMRRLARLIRLAL